VSGVTSGAGLGYEPVPPSIDPEPSQGEREAILAALTDASGAESGWAAAALLEGVGDDELDPYLF